MRKQENFKSALAVSVALHFLLLWPALSLDGRGGGAQTLSVALQLLPSKPPLLAANEAAAVPPHPPVASKRVLAREMPALQAPVPSSSENASPSSTVETPAHSGAQPAGDVAATAQASGQPAAGADAGAGVDADGVRQYRVALAVEARRFKRYPARALADDLGGTVEIRVAVAAGGRTQEVALSHSSGHEALDDAALDMMRKAAPRTAVPELLRQRAFSVSLPVVFDAADD